MRGGGKRPGKGSVAISATVVYNGTEGRKLYDHGRALEGAYDRVPWQQRSRSRAEAGCAEPLLDFGYGFYTTTNRAQAISFADKVTKRRGSGQRTVSVYALDEEEAFSACSLLRFDQPGEAWLDFVSANRSGKAPGQGGDFIFGPVANDDVYRTFTLYSAGLLTKEQTLEQLKVKRLYDQLVLTTEKALSYLRFTGTVPEEEF